MNNAEVNVRNKGFKDDEIYEGGDAIAQPSQAESSIAYDPSKEYINMDEYENAPGGHQKIARTRLKRVKDWRLTHKKSWISAYRKGDLRPNDKELIHSFAFSIFSALVLMGALYGVYKDVIAVMIVIPGFYLGICILIATTVIQ